MRRPVLALVGLVLLAGCGENVVTCDPCPGDQISVLVRTTEVVERPARIRVRVRVCIDGAECFRSRVWVSADEPFGSIGFPDLGDLDDLDGHLFRVTFDDGVSRPVTTMGRLSYDGGSGECSCSGLFGETGVVLGAEGLRTGTSM